MTNGHRVAVVVPYITLYTTKAATVMIVALVIIIVIITTSSSAIAERPRCKVG